MTQAREKHPPGLFVLSATEMWERFGFYTMNGMLVLYMKNSLQGFGWSAAKAATINSYYLFFVYFTPLLGGYLADKLLGFRRSVTLGALLFMVGYVLLTIPNNIPMFYLALVFLVTGNGFFKPNISSMVGNLYSEQSRLKDRAYLVFYMGINIGATLAPIVAEVVRTRYGFHPAFGGAALGMVISLCVFWGLGRHIAHTDVRHRPARPVANGEAGAVTEDFPPSDGAQSALEAVPESRRLAALIVVFAVVIVFWMIFHQNSSTLTLWADENTDWNVTGILSNAINPAWIIILATPLASFWSAMDRRGWEPSTPGKIACGMLLTSLSFLLLWAAALSGGYTKPVAKVAALDAATGELQLLIAQETRAALAITTPPQHVPLVIRDRSGQSRTETRDVWRAQAMAGEQLAAGDLARIESTTDGRIQVARARKVSPLWLIIAYFIIALGELMLSPMGLSLVSKVAPPRMRGLMMGGWFAATAIGNKLTAIGVYWEVWSHATFFLVLSMMALAMAVFLVLILKPLKRAMPGV